jgi:hypothetical protein
MRDEPRGELARYAFGYSDKKPSMWFWVIHAAMLAFVVWAIFISPAYSATCHHYSTWKYPWPQRCYSAYAPPSLKRRAAEQDNDWYVEIEKLPPSWKLDEEQPHIEVTVPETVQDPDRDRGLQELKGLLK